MSKLLTLLSLPVGLALAAASPAAWSVNKQTPAAGACKSALPAFDGLIRTRPLAVQNEGTAPAFVTCAQQGDFDQLPTSISIVLMNQNAWSVTVNCTLVAGSTSQAYTSIATLVGAGSNNTFVAFLPPIPGSPFPSPNHAFSCNLPPGTGISRLSVVHD